MKITICGSMSSARKMVEMGSELMAAGHEVVLPRNAEEYADGLLAEETAVESIKNKIDHDLIRDYFETIQSTDALLVVNIDKNGIENYIGGNAFLEMGFAHVLDKKIFLLNPIPEVGYKDEILAMQPIVINQDLNKIK